MTRAWSAKGRRWNGDPYTFTVEVREDGTGWFSTEGPTWSNEDLYVDFTAEDITALRDMLNAIRQEE